MAEQLVFVTRGDASEAKRVLDAFAAETGLTPEHDGRQTRFALDDDDHRIKVVETLNEIDPDWSGHLALGPPDAAGP
jgi:hypothetical protein